MVENVFGGGAIAGMKHTLAGTFPEAKRSLLQQADQTCTERRKVYGSPYPNFLRIAALWQVALQDRLAPGAKITTLDVAQLMRLVKEARLIETPNHLDSLLDIAGYVDCAEMCIKEQ